MARWAWAAASRCGTAHRDANGHRQDAFRIISGDGGFLVAVACDGAGSASHGRFGATIAARVITQRAKEWIGANTAIPSPTKVEFWVAEARLAIIVAADGIGLEMADFASTLVLAISNGDTTLTAHIGDGAIIAGCSKRDTLLEMSWPQGGEFAATTFFITDPNLRLRIGLMTGWPIDRLAIMTDGLERLALDFSRQLAHRPFFDRLFDAMNSAAEPGCCRSLSQALSHLLDTDAVNGRTDDDKTLLLAVLR